MYVVPNHMLEQFAREFLQLYPNASCCRRQGGPLPRPAQAPRPPRSPAATGTASSSPIQLVRADRHVARNTRSGSCASRSPNTTRCSRDTPGRDAATAHRNIIKTIEKQKAAREEKLKDLLAEDKKDDGLVFDELGVDHIFVDEAHYFKNLETPTKMDRVAGIQTGGSRAGLRPLHEVPIPPRAAPRPRRDVRHRHADHQHDGRDVHHAALPRPGRPPVARHRAFRRLGSHVRRNRRRDGDLARRRIAAAPQPLRQVRQPAGTAADVPHVRRRADGRHARPAACPRWKAASRTIVACPMSDEQRAIQQNWSPATSASARGKVDPRRTTRWPSPPTAASWPSMPGCSSASAADFPDRRSTPWSTTSPRSGGRPPTRAARNSSSATWASTRPAGASRSTTRSCGSWSSAASRAEQIAVIGDADTDAKKQALFDKVRAGKVRVLLG